MPLNEKFFRLQRIVNTTLLAVIVLGLISLSTYVGVKYFEDPVEYKKISLNKEVYTTGDNLTYYFDVCRNAGEEVPGDISRSFVPVQLVDGKWETIKGKAPVPLFQSAFVTNKKGCRQSKITTIVPYMDSGNYQLRIVGTYTKLEILPKSVDTIQSGTVQVIKGKDNTVKSEGNGIDSQLYSVQGQSDPQRSTQQNSTAQQGNVVQGQDVVIEQEIAQQPPAQATPQPQQTRGLVPRIVNGILDVTTKGVKDLSIGLLGQ